MKFLFNDTYIIITTILELHPFSSCTVEKYEESQRGRILLHSLFSDSCLDHIVVEDIKLAILGQDLTYNGFIFINGSRIEFDKNSDIVSGYVKACRYDAIPVPEGSKIVFNVEGEPERITLSETIRFKNRTIRKGYSIVFTVESDDELIERIRNELYPQVRHRDFIVESERFCYDNYEDGGKNIGYPCRETGHYGSLSTYDKYDNEFSYFGED